MFILAPLFAFRFSLSPSLTETKSGYPAGLPEDVVCAGYFTARAQPCSGDSGGPLVVEDQGRFYLTGIVSFGADDEANGVLCKRGYPALFTDRQNHEGISAAILKQVDRPNYASSWTMIHGAWF